VNGKERQIERKGVEEGVGWGGRRRG